MAQDSSSSSVAQRQQKVGHPYSRPERRDSWEVQNFCAHFGGGQLGVGLQRVERVLKYSDFSIGQADELGESSVCEAEVLIFLLLLN